MPTYEYRCSACGHQFEDFQSISAEPFEICPECGRSSLKRMFGGGGGMIFKGSGFYLTDYKKTGSTQSSNTKSPSPTAPASDKKGKAAPSPPSKPPGDS